MIRVDVNKQDLRKLLATIADMDVKARQRLEKKAIRQGLNPLLKRVRSKWRAGGGPTRRAIAKATRLRVDRMRTGGPRGRRESFGGVAVSYKNKYGKARLAHMLENPNNDYRTAGPNRGKDHTGTRRQYPNRKYGRMTPGSRIHSRAFVRMQSQIRRGFLVAAQAFIAGYDTKSIRQAIQGMKY